MDYAEEDSYPIILTNGVFFLIIILLILEWISL